MGQSGALWPSNRKRRECERFQLGSRTRGDHNRWRRLRRRKQRRYVTGVVHLPILLPSLGKDYGLGIYAIPQLTLGPKPAPGVTGVLAVGHEPETARAWDVNLTGFITKDGSLNSPTSPTFDKLWSVGILGSRGTTATDKRSSSGYEFYGNFLKSAGSSGPSVTGVRLGGGYTHQWNWAQGSDQTNGAAVYLGLVGEYGRITPAAASGAAAPEGVNALTISGVLSISIGAQRREPQHP